MKSPASIARPAPAPLRKVPGGVLAPSGFTGGAAACGIKDGKAARADLAFLACPTPCAAAGTFTTNAVKAAPVRVSMRHLRRGVARGVILNSGNANACTGESGMAAARDMAAAAAGKIGARPSEILVCSTGRIGIPLPIERIHAGLQTLKLSRAVGTPMARAIMTSDTFPKQIAVEVASAAGKFRIGAMAKGAGMINPDMATMLCVVTTDAVVEASLLREALWDAVAESFNRITVDGDMSTNDTVLALANGASGVHPHVGDLAKGLRHVTSELARMMVLDGEGVSRFIELEVRGAASARDARIAAEAVANSTLVKCAWAGGDPNWGRIMDALGYSGARIREDRIRMDYAGLPIVRGGIATPTPWKKLRAAAAKPTLRIQIDLGLGDHAHEVWTTDLTEEYVRLNLGE